MLTFGQIQNSSIANIAGVNVNDPTFANYVSDAVRNLCNLGDWIGCTETMVSQVYIDSRNGVMVWPYFVDAVLAVKQNHRLAPPKNFWYEFVPTNGEWSRVVAGVCCGNREGHHHHHGYQHVVRFAGTTPVLLSPSAANPFAVQAVAENSADYGKTVTIFGKDTNGNEVYTTQGGIYQRGCTLTLAATPVISKDDNGNVVNFISISAVVKQQTGAEVNLFVYSQTTPYAQVVANYAANETNPQYLFSQLSHVIQPSWKFIEALVKIRPLPVVNPNDIVPLNNIEAIKSMIQSIRYKESGDIENSQKYEADAIRRLNMELNTKYPLDQVEASNQTFSTAHPRNPRRPY
jgi:hypothetical protein